MGILSMSLLPGPLTVVVPVRVPSRDQIDKFKDYSHSIGPWAKKKFFK